MGLDYLCIRTVKIDANYFSHFVLKPEIYGKAWKSEMYVLVDEVKKYVQNL